MVIPLDLINVRFDGQPIEMKGNFYKCASATSAALSELESDNIPYPGFPSAIGFWVDNTGCITACTAKVSYTECYGAY